MAAAVAVTASPHCFLAEKSWLTVPGSCAAAQPSSLTHSHSQIYYVWPVCFPVFLGFPHFMVYSTQPAGDTKRTEAKELQHKIRTNKYYYAFILFLFSAVDVVPSLFFFFRCPSDSLSLSLSTFAAISVFGVCVLLLFAVGRNINDNFVCV